MSKIEWEYTGYDYQAPNIQRDYLYIGDWRVKISDLEKTIPEHLTPNSMESGEIYSAPDPMNPLCDVWTYKGADRWYWTKEDAEKAYKESDLL